VVLAVGAEEGASPSRVFGQSWLRDVLDETS
jgi:hypothetical protein